VGERERAAEEKESNETERHSRLSSIPSPWMAHREEAARRVKESAEGEEQNKQKRKENNRRKR